MDSAPTVTIRALSVMHVWVLVAHDGCTSESLLEDDLLGIDNCYNSMSPLQKAYFHLSEAGIKGTFLVQ